MHPAHFFNSFAQAAAPVSVASLWQGIAVAAVIALCIRFAPQFSATQRFVIWLGGFIAVAALPFSPLALRFLASPRATSPFTQQPSQPWLQIDARWTLVLAAIWLLASTARAADLAFHIVRLRRLWITANPIEVSTQPQAERSFQICSTQALDRPSVIGFFAPRILIPDWLLARLSPEEFQQIVLHESTHLRRRDDWTNLFQKLCLVFFPLNPGLWAIDRFLAKEREMACDEAVVRITQAPRAYAACLASLAERGMTHRREALSLGAWQRRSELVNRVHRILRSHRGLSPIAARVLLGAVGCSLLVATVELARCPQLVAFVPAVSVTQTASASNLPAQQGDAVYPSNPHNAMLTAGAHIVRAKVEMPAAPTTKQNARRPQTSTAINSTLRARVSVPRMLPRAPQSTESQYASATEAEQHMPPQFIVLTTWQQIETATPPSRTVIADYDTEQPAPADSAAAKPIPSAPAPAQNKQQPATGPCSHTCPKRITTFSQLILRIVPQNSQAAQPTAIPIGDGWFVIQL